MPRKPSRSNVPAGDPSVPSEGWLEGGVSAVTITLLIARYLTATEGAVLGETLWIVQLALFTLLGWIFAEYRQGTIRWCIDRFDLGIVLIVSGELLSAAWNWDGANQRALVNILWEWIGLLITWFLLRRLLKKTGSSRPIVVAVVAIGATLAGLGIWQHYAGFAEMRREVARLQNEWDALQEAGRPDDPRDALEWEQKTQRLRAEFVRMRIPTDAGARILWNQRVNESSEPVGTSALANTFAGVLIVTALLGCGWLLVRAESPEARRRALELAVPAVLVGITIYCLILTKSRTGYVGFMAGLAAGLFAWRLGRQASRRGWYWLAAAAAGIGLVVVVAGLTGGLDRLVLSESFKSLRYRGEYWLGSWRMLTEEPARLILGVGAGNFRSSYLSHKLPESSEEIADPHNLILDLWSSGGIVALTGLAWLMATGCSALWRRDESLAAPSTAPPSRQSLWKSPIFWGGLIAFGATWLIGGSFDERMLPLGLAWALVISVLWNQGDHELPALWFGASLLALGVHLLGAGGISMPAITQTVLLLVVLGTNGVKSAALSGAIESRAASLGVGLLGVGLYLLCWFTALIPVMNARTDLDVGDQALYEEGRPEKAQRAYRRAVDADPLSGEACERLAQLNLQRWLASRDSENEHFDQAVYWQRMAIVREPRNYGAYRALGSTYLTRYDRTRDPEDAVLAAEEFNRAVTLYPNHAELLSELAEAQWRAGETASARTFAERAQELDGLNQTAGHLDKILSESRREVLTRILASDVEVPTNTEGEAADR
jgi:tetratricopeptide (TPR) repeat protein